MNKYLKFSKYWCNACDCVCVCLYAEWAQVPIDTIRSPGVTGYSESPDMGGGSQPRTLAEQQECLTAEPSPPNPNIRVLM